MNRLINQAVGGDDEALPYLKTLLASEYADEALHQQDNAKPYWTLLHKFAFYGCPKCADIVIKVKETNERGQIEAIKNLRISLTSTFICVVAPLTF